MRRISSGTISCWIWSSNAQSAAQISSSERAWHLVCRISPCVQHATEGSHLAREIANRVRMVHMHLAPSVSV